MYINTKKILLSILKHSFFFASVIFCNGIHEILSLKVSLRKERIAVYFSSSRVFLKQSPYSITFIVNNKILFWEDILASWP